MFGTVLVLLLVLLWFCYAPVPSLVLDVGIAFVHVLACGPFLCLVRGFVFLFGTGLGIALAQVVCVDGGVSLEFVVGLFGYRYWF